MRRDQTCRTNASFRTFQDTQRRVLDHEPRSIGGRHRASAARRCNFGPTASSALNPRVSRIDLNCHLA
jgi:hypothetical protein